LLLLFSQNIIAYGLSSKDPCGCTEQFPDLGYSNQHVHLDEVKELQQLLFDLGYYKGKITGVYDKKTLEAVNKFQIKTGLAADGKVR
jgi:peptidoglycan hydrolase-like protein with peptidoglycan-binding domain